MPTTLEAPPPIAALSVQDAAITGERKSLHGYVTERVLRRARAEKQIVSRPVLRYVKVLAALGILGSQVGYAETSSAEQNPITAIDIALQPGATMIQYAEAVKLACVRPSRKASLWTRPTIHTSRSCSATSIRRTSTKSTTRSARF